MSKANYDLPDVTLEKVRKLSAAKSKREAIIIALEDFIKRKKIERLINASGKIKLNWSQKSLKAYRG